MRLGNTNTFQTPCVAMPTVRDFHFPLRFSAEGQFSDYWDIATAKVPAHAGPIESLNSSSSVGSQRIYENLVTRVSCHQTSTCNHSLKRWAHLRDISPPCKLCQACKETALGQGSGISATMSLSKNIFLQLIFILLKIFGHSERKHKLYPQKWNRTKSKYVGVNRMLLHHVQFVWKVLTFSCSKHKPSLTAVGS